MISFIDNGDYASICSIGPSKLYSTRCCKNDVLVDCILLDAMQRHRYLLILVSIWVTKIELDKLIFLKKMAVDSASWGRLPFIFMVVQLLH